MVKSPRQIFRSTVKCTLRSLFKSGGEHKALWAMFFLALIGFVHAPQSVRAQEPPSVAAQSNAPGWITVRWEHSGRGTARYLLQRQEPPFTWVYEANVGSYTDMGLKASTTYNYRVCAVSYNNEETCSPWISATTMPPESSSPTSIPVITRRDVAVDRIGLSWSSKTRYGSFNVRWTDSGGRARQVNVKGNLTYGSYEIRDLQSGRSYSIGVQGCNRGLFASSCSGWRVFNTTTLLPPPPPPTAPAVTASASGQSQIVLTWPIVEAERITRTVVERDGQQHNERAGAFGRFDDSVRPNAEYSYRVCLTNETGKACSNPVIAMAQPVAPSALADVTFTHSRFSGAPGGGLSGEGARIKTVLRANWRNAGTPGQFIILEREDRGPIDPIRVGTSWTEIKRITAKTEPTEIAIEVKPAGAQIGVRDGNSYRVCTVVPALGKTGKVCSSPYRPEDTAMSDHAR